MYLRRPQPSHSSSLVNVPSFADPRNRWEYGVGPEVGVVRGTGSISDNGRAAALARRSSCRHSLVVLVLGAAPGVRGVYITAESEG